MNLLIVFIVFVVVLWAAFRLMPQPGSKFHPGALSLQALITVFVAGVAGYWYLIERRGTAHANVELSAVGVRLNETTALVQVRVAVRNTGQILLVPQTIDLRLLSVLPPGELPLEAAARAAIHSLDRWPGWIDGAPTYSAGELRWTGLRQYRGPAMQEIEPGERDSRIFDLLVPCGVQVAKLTVQLRKPRSEWWQRREPEGGWWWKDRMLIGVGSLCAGEVGVVRSLGPDAPDERERGEG